MGEPELIPAPVPRRLSEVTGPLDDVLGEHGAKQRDDWVRVIVTDATRPRDMIARIKERFPHALVMQHRPVGVETRATQSLTVTAASDPTVVAADFVEHVSGEAPTSSERDVLRAAFEAAGAAERSA